MGSETIRKRRQVKESRILGLDLSLCSTGYCLLIGDTIGTYGVIKPKTKGVERLVYIRCCVDKIMTAAAPLTLVVLEGYSMGSRGGRVFSIGELGGIIKLECYNRTFETIIIPPMTLKKFITGKGNSGKDVMLKQTYKKYGFDTNDNNICDAFGLTKVGQAYLEGTKLEYEKQALEKVEVLS